MVLLIVRIVDVVRIFESLVFPECGLMAVAKARRCLYSGWLRNHARNWATRRECLWGELHLRGLVSMESCEGVRAFPNSPSLSWQKAIIGSEDPLVDVQAREKE